METKPLFRIDHYTEKERPAGHRLRCKPVTSMIEEMYNPKKESRRHRRKMLDSYKELIPASTGEDQFIDAEEFDSGNVESSLIKAFRSNEKYSVSGPIPSEENQPNADLQSSSRSQDQLNDVETCQSKK